MLIHFAYDVLIDGFLSSIKFQSLKISNYLLTMCVQERKRLIKLQIKSSLCLLILTWSSVLYTHCYTSSHFEHYIYFCPYKNAEAFVKFSWQTKEEKKKQVQFLFTDDAAGELWEVCRYAIYLLVRKKISCIFFRRILSSL